MLLRIWYMGVLEQCFSGRQTCTCRIHHRTTVHRSDSRLPGLYANKREEGGMKNCLTCKYCPDFGKKYYGFCTWESKAPMPSIFTATSIMLVNGTTLRSKDKSIIIDCAAHELKEDV